MLAGNRIHIIITSLTPIPLWGQLCIYLLASEMRGWQWSLVGVYNYTKGDDRGVWCCGWAAWGGGVCKGFYKGFYNNYYFRRFSVKMVIFQLILYGIFGINIGNKMGNIF